MLMGSADTNACIVNTKAELTHHPGFSGQEMVALREDLRRAAEQHQTSPVNKRTLRVQLGELQEQFQKELAEKDEEHERELEAAKEASEEKLQEEMQRLKQLQEQLEEQQHTESWIC